MTRSSRPVLRAACAALVAVALWPAAPAFAQSEAPSTPSAAATETSTPTAEPPPGPPDVLGDQPTFDPSVFAVRHAQLGLHQGFALATLGAMAATGGLGYWSASLDGPAEMRDLHLAAAGLTSGLYLTSAALAVTAPPNPLRQAHGPWDTVEIHEKAAWLHAAGMATTVGLGLATVFAGSQYADYHGIAAATTFGLMALSAGVIAFGE